MPCPRCGYENPSNARFCARCNFVLQADINAYHPDEQMKVVLPPVIRPLQPVFKARPVAAPAHQPAANSAPLNPAAADADQTVLLPPKAAATPRESEPGAGKRTSKRPAALAKQATHFSLAIGIGSVLLLAMAVGYYLVQLRKEKPVDLALPPVTISAPVVVVSEPAPAPVAASEPIATTSPPAEALLPQSAVAEAVAPTPIVSASAPDPVTETATEPVVAPPPSGPRVLAPREVAALLRSLRTRSSVPADCQSATTMLINDYDVVPRQAGRIAKLAYPELCMPAKPTAPTSPRLLPAPERAGNTASPATPPAQTRAKARTIDEVYEERIGSECSRGAFGHICRESIRLTLCSGKLSDNPPPGQTVCTQ